MRIKLFVTISLLLAVSSEVWKFIQSDDITNAQAAAAAIPPNIVPNSNPVIESATSPQIDQNYQFLSTAYQQVNAIIIGFQSANTSYSSGSMSDEEFTNTILSMIPQPFSNEVSNSDISAVYSGFLCVYSRCKMRLLNILSQISYLNEHFGRGIITDDEFVSGLNEIYQSNGDLLDYSYLYYFEQWIVSQLDDPITG